MSNHHNTSKNAKRTIHAEGAYIEGKIETGRDFIGRDQNLELNESIAYITQSFTQILTAIDTNTTLSATEKGDLKNDVKEIQEELSKGEKANETFLSRRLRNIGRIAPDILQVVAATISNPLAGLSLVAKKIADRAQNEPIANQEKHDGR